MRQPIHFELHKYAPELNKAYINGCAIPGYIAVNDDYEEQLRHLRRHFHTRLPFHSRVTITHTGATSSLPNELFVIGKGLEHRKLFLAWLRGKSAGIGSFYISPDVYVTKQYGYKFIRAVSAGSK